ncbi:hypothetical protein BKA80DRAFT_139676 [Phyllosticta citrichinensis]
MLLKGSYKSKRTLHRRISIARRSNFFRYPLWHARQKAERKDGKEGVFRAVKRAPGPLSVDVGGDVARPPSPKSDTGVVDLTGASESPEPTEQDVRNAEEASRAIEESITKILGAAHVTGGSDMASPRWHTNSYHIDCLLKLSSVIELHHLPAESPTQLARAFYAFSQLSMNEISDEKINWLRDLVRHGPYSRETEAKPGEFFANAAACEKVACQFSDLHVQFKMIIWCQSCQQRVPQEHVSRTAIIEMIDPEDMDGPDPSGDIGTNISRSFGQRDQQTKTPCQRWVQKVQVCSGVPQRPSNVYLGGRYRPRCPPPPLHEARTFRVRHF